MFVNSIENLGSLDCMCNRGFVFGHNFFSIPNDPKEQ